MGHWGVKSYENDDAADALDDGFERVHGDRYDAMMDDRSPTPFEKVQEQLASPETLAEALASLVESAGHPPEDFDAIERLAFAGIVVRHAECRVPIPDDRRATAIDWLEREEIEWPEATMRRLRRAKEIALLRRGDFTAEDAEGAESKKRRREEKKEK